MHFPLSVFSYIRTDANKRACDATSVYIVHVIPFCVQLKCLALNKKSERHKSDEERTGMETNIKSENILLKRHWISIHIQMNRCSTHRCVRFLCFGTCFWAINFSINSNGKCKRKHRHMCVYKCLYFRTRIENIQTMRFLRAVSMIKPESPVNDVLFCKGIQTRRWKKLER